MPTDDRAPCPTCGSILEGSGPAAFCPACLWRVFADEEQDDRATPAADALFSVPGHEVLAEIARGGGGIVYRARQGEPRRDVALKMLLPYQVTSDELIARFRVEAETVAQLDHPAILPVYAVGEHRGMPYFTMKLATGGTLGSRVAALQGHWRAIAELVVTLAHALQFAHAHGVIHRDVKPGNVLFDGDDRPYLSDFGLAKFVDADSPVTRTVGTFGTPAYLAPELVTCGMGAATIASDVYGLGGVLYELLTGRAPFAAESLPLLLQRVATEAPTSPRRHLPETPRDLEVICLRCLAKEPEKRFSSALDLAADLQRWLAGQPIESRPASPAERLWRWARRHPLPATLAALLMLVVLGSGIVLARSNRSIRAAHAGSQTQLRAALIAEGRLLRASGQVGQRYGALEVLDRAAALGPSMELRSEVAAALARPDLKLLRELPVEISGGHFAIHFNDELTAYLTGLADESARPAFKGPIVLRSLEDGRILRTYGGERDLPIFLRFSRDGQRFVARHLDLTRDFWAIAGEKPAFSDGPTSRLLWVGDAQHPTRPRIALHTGRSGITVHDFDTGTARQIYEGPNEIVKLRYSPTGDRLLIAAHGRLEVIDAETGASIWVRNDDVGGQDPVWSRDGTRVAWCRREAIVISDAANGAPRSEVSGQWETVTWMEFSHDGTMLVAMSRDQTLRMWDVGAARELLRANVAASGFGLAPDGNRIATTVWPSSVAVYDSSASGVFTRLRADRQERPTRAMLALAASPHSRLVLTATFSLQRENVADSDSTADVILWDGAREREAGRCSFPIYGSVWVNEAATALFSPAGDVIYYGSQTSGTLRRRLINGPDGTVSLGEEESIPGAGRGTLLKAIGAGGDWYLQHYEDGRIVVWPGGDATRERTLHTTKTFDLNIVVSADEHWGVSWGNYVGDYVALWSPAEPDHGVRNLSVMGWRMAGFSPDNASLFASTTREAMSWRLPDLEPGPAWAAPPDGDQTRSFAFSPDGRWLASAASRNVLELRDTQTWEVVIRLEAPSDFQRCVWSADGTEIYLLDVTGGETRLFRWNLPVLRRELASRGLDW